MACKYYYNNSEYSEEEFRQILSDGELLSLFNNKTLNYDKTYKQRVSSFIEKRQTIEQAQPVEGTGAEAAPTSGILQGSQEVDFENAPTSTIEEEMAAEEEFDTAVSQVKELAPEFSEDDLDYAASLVQMGVEPGEAIEFTRNTPEESRMANETEVEKIEANETEVTKTVEPTGQVGRQTTGEKSAEIFTEADTAIGKSGVDATTARREMKEKYGAEQTKKAIKITREFESIVNRLEKEGKLKKVCP